jgi:hypothetical protein
LELDGCFRPRLDEEKFVGDKVFRIKGYKTEKQRILVKLLEIYKVKLK